MTRISRTGGGGAPISSVSNSDGTLTISPTTGAVVASLALAHANTWTATQTFREIDTSADNTYPIGTATNRFSAVHSVLFNVEHASADANPSAQLGDQFLKIGLGGSSTLSAEIQRTVTVGQHSLLFSGIVGATEDVHYWSFAPITTGINRLLIFRTSDYTTNYEALMIGSDITPGTFSIFVSQGGTGSYRPLSFFNGGIEVFRIQTASPFFKFNEGTTGTGTPTFGANCPAVTVGAPYTWIKVASADGSTVYIPAWK